MIAAELEAARRLLKVMDEHLGFLEAQVPALQIPSENQAFFYVSDGQGFIKIQQDSAFLAEWVILRVPQMMTQRPDALVSVRDRGPGLVVTLGRQLISGVIHDSVTIPWNAMVPVSGQVAGPGLRANTDYIYRLPVEWELARGTAVQAEFSAVGLAAAVTTLGADFGVSRLVLFGHKVFG